MNGLRFAWQVFRKELVDALRDRRTLLAVILSSVFIGPLMLTLISVLVSDMEQRAEAREVYVSGIEHAPTLRNYLERQTLVVKVAPADFEKQLRAADPPLVEVVSSSANQRAANGAGRVARLLRGFDSEQAVLRLALRGVSPALLRSVTVEDRDLASPASRGATITGMLPFFVLMAVLYGAMTAALDTTAGERERGSLEPLLMTPPARWALVVGKWAAVASVGMLIAVLSCASFLPGQWILRSETLAALFQFGPREAGLFIAVLLPLAAAVAALMMAIAIRCKSFKEAQANNTIVILVVSLLPLVTVMNQGGDKAWHLWVPALAQMVLMGRVLKGEALALSDTLPVLAGCTLLCVLCIAFVARRLAAAAVK